MTENSEGLRYELKLVCDGGRVPQARSWIRLHPAGFTVAYPPRRVNSLYLDTCGFHNFNENLEGLSSRQKLRLRWYGDATEGIQPILELKQKYNMLGRKKTFHFPHKLSLNTSWKEILTTLRESVPPEWLIRLQTVQYPALINRYWREYYVTHDGAIRATLDFNQVAYAQNHSQRPNLRIPLSIPDTLIIEIKADQEYGERLETIAAWFPISRSRNSKYAGGLLASQM